MIVSLVHEMKDHLTLTLCLDIRAMKQLGSCVFLVNLFTAWLRCCPDKCGMHIPTLVLIRLLHTPISPAGTCANPPPPICKTQHSRRTTSTASPRVDAHDCLLTVAGPDLTSAKRLLFDTAV